VGEGGCGQLKIQAAASNGIKWRGSCGERKKERGKDPWPIRNNWYSSTVFFRVIRFFAKTGRCLVWTVPGV